MYVLLSLLLICSFACIGLVALWAATSRRHWFLRTIAVGGPLCVLLLVPAYEPLVAFAVEAAMIAGVLNLARSICLRYWRPDDVTPRRYVTLRFSMLSLL